MYDSIKSIRPYFYSLREIESYVTLDIKIPLTWKYIDIIQTFESIKYKVQDKNDKFILLSIITNSDENGYSLVFLCANEIIKVNKEEEEKQLLFQQKLLELQELFEKENLDILRSLNLKLLTDGQGITNRDEFIGEGEKEEFERDRELQEKSNRRVKTNRQKQNV